MFTTLNQIRANSPCASGWKKLLVHLNKTIADAEPLNIATVIDRNGLDDALWCLQAVEYKDKEIRLYAVWCARQVQHLMTDKRIIDILDVSERFANGEATQEELNSARDAACDSARSASDSAWYSADAARLSASGAARRAADAVWDAALDARAARAAMRNAQETKLREICQ